MGMLDITIGEDDINTVVATVGGALIGGPAGAAAGYMMAEQVNNQNQMQQQAIEDEQRRLEEARYDSLLRQTSAEIQADQSMLASLMSGGNNGTNGQTGVNTNQNQEVGSSTSGTF